MNMLQAQQLEKRLSRIHLYKGKQLVGLTLAAAISVLLSAGDYQFHSSLSWLSGPLVIASIILYLLVIATILVIDWHGFLTMNGGIKWRSMSDSRIIFVGCIFVLCNVFFLGYYLVRAYQKYRNYKRLKPLRVKRQEAELEAKLGFIPPTDGECRKCHQLIQVGSEFCSFCGESVIERPLICPQCFATALPGSKWCPSCRAPLDRRDGLVQGHQA
jgi:hypothetical protein